jgi:hypothetical protein
VIVTRPVLAIRTWQWRYRAPRSMGWPTIMSGHPKPERRSLIQVSEIAVNIRQGISAGGEPAQDPCVESIAIKGQWVSSRRPVGWMQLVVRDSQRSALTTEAPDWVMKIADDALGRCK